MIIALMIAIYIIEGRISNSIFCLAALGIFLTLSRSGVLCLLIVYIVLNFRNITLKNAIKGFMGLLTIYISVIMLLSTTTLESSFLSKLALQRINPFEQAMLIDNDSSRFHLLQRYWEGISEKPIFGHGPQTGMKGLDVEGVEINLRAHNTFLNIWYEVGIFGALSFLSFLLFVIVAGLKRTSALLVAVVCLFYTFFINNLLWMPQFWLMVGLLLAVNRKEKGKFI